MSTVTEIEQEIQQLERQLVVLKRKLREATKEPLPTGTKVRWEVWGQSCCRPYLEDSFEGVVVNREFREESHPQNSRWFYSVQTDDTQVHVGVDGWNVKEV